MSWLAAVRGGRALRQLITILLQLAKSLILHNTDTHQINNLVLQTRDILLVNL